MAAVSLAEDLRHRRKVVEEAGPARAADQIYDPLSLWAPIAELKRVGEYRQASDPSGNTDGTPNATPRVDGGRRLAFFRRIALRNGLPAAATPPVFSVSA